MARTRTVIAGVAIVAALTLALAGCVDAPEEEPTSSPTPVDLSKTPDPNATPDGEPILRPGESAAANLQFFDKVNGDFYRGDRLSGRKIIDNLVENGFLKQDMEVTPDRTAIDLKADSIFFSVRIGNECLVGQFNAKSYKGAIEPILGSGGCLVGATRDIDW